MARSGVTQDDVNAAADRLLDAGERPTIERVRAALGTGSPNTLIRLLDVWWAALGRRLRAHEAKGASPDAPAGIVAAVTALWDEALSAAQAHAKDGLQLDRQALLADRIALDAERRDLLQQAKDQATARALAQQAQTVAEARLAEAERFAEQQTAQLKDVLHQRDATQHRADRLEQELMTLSDRLQKQETAAAVDRDSHAQYVQAIENRAHAEIDRARLETKELRGRITALERDHTLQLQDARNRCDEAFAVTAAAQQEATAQRARADALEQQLTRLGDLPAALQATLAKTRDKPARRREKPHAASSNKSKPRKSS
jgi:hypothetical protein